MVSAAALPITTEDMIKTFVDLAVSISQYNHYPIVVLQRAILACFKRREKR